MSCIFVKNIYFGLFCEEEEEEEEEKEEEEKDGYSTRLIRGEEKKGS